MIFFFFSIIDQGSKNQSPYSDTNSKLSGLRHSLGLLDANFFNNKQVVSLTCEFGVTIYDAWW